MVRANHAIPAEKDPQGVILNGQAGSRAVIAARELPGAGSTSLYLCGELDLSCVAEIARVADDVTGRGRSLVVELADVTFVDAAFLGALVHAKNAAAAAGTAFQTQDAPPFVRRLIALTGLGHLLDEAVPGDSTVSAV